MGSRELTERFDRHQKVAVRGVTAIASYRAQLSVRFEFERRPLMCVHHDVTGRGASRHEDLV